MTDPRDFTSAETLKNGLAVTIRHLRADDRDRIAKAVRQLDRESIYTRLFSYRNELTERGARPHHEGRSGTGGRTGRHHRCRRRRDRDRIGPLRRDQSGRQANAPRRWRSSSRRTTRASASPAACSGTLRDIAREQGIVRVRSRRARREQVDARRVRALRLADETRTEGGTVHVTLSLRDAPA